MPEDNITSEVPFHFTYEKPDFSSLNQGDILKRTAAINNLLSEIHPHFTKDDYKYLCVLTQGCDLVCRDGDPCSARYINLAAVRPMSLLIKRELTKLCSGSIEKKLGLIGTKRKAKIAQFLERIYNNNEDDYFYLCASPESGLSEDYCVFLRLSIPIKSELHYATLLDAKVIQLKESFQHKLGYLVGKTYSRIGTADWSPDVITKDKFDEKIEEYIVRQKDFVWMEDDQLKPAVKQLSGLPLEQHTIENVMKVIEGQKSQKKKRKE